MDIWDISIFVETMRIEGFFDLKDTFKPIRIKIRDESNTPGILFYMSDEQFIKFKNDVLEAYDKFQKERGYKR